jgi:hypothetical protein
MWVLMVKIVCKLFVSQENWVYSWDIGEACGQAFVSQENWVIVGTSVKACAQAFVSQEK